MAPIRSSLFDISITSSAEKMVIALFFPQKKVTTTHITSLTSLLQQELPSVLLSTCFNSDNLPFSEEVKKTEFGHLFEHILLEYLCIAKLSMGFQEASFSGFTSWDWRKKKYGTFSVTLPLEKTDLLYMSPALNRTIRLFEKILMHTEMQKKQNTVYA